MAGLRLGINLEQFRCDMPDDPTPQRTPNDDNDAVEARSNDRVVSTVELFGDLREIWIEHDGERYRLRITRRNKLILQK